ncbi:MAG: gephyrin-like molybdotransferase Glp [Pseudomonadota bacterium]
MTQPNKGLLSFEDAFAKVTDVSPIEDVDTVALHEAYGRVVAQPVIAKLTQPPHAVSAMDGYAVIANDTEDANAPLQVVAHIAAGDAPKARIERGQAARIFTGAPVPRGADAVLIQENTISVSDKTIQVTQPVKGGANIRSRGLDFENGHEILKPGTKLSTAALSLAAAASVPKLDVRRRPRVGILSTGNELVPPGETPRDGQIIASNAVGIAALIENTGAHAFDLGLARDDAKDIQNAIEHAKTMNLDALVTLGGASVGDHDLVKPTLEAMGAQMNFWRVAVRPGKPIMYGKLNGMRLLGLPGNPVSSLVCAHLFLRPLLNALAGLPSNLPFQQAKLTKDCPANGARRHFMRAQSVWTRSGERLVSPIGSLDSSLLTKLTEADCLINVAPNTPEMGVGSVVTVLPLL